MRANGEVIEVRCRAGVPVRFRRPAIGGAGRVGLRARGPRWYAVRAVLGFWVESSAWWRSSAARAVLALEASEPIESAEGVSADGASWAGEQVVWRVEARPEVRQNAAIGVYELVRGIDGRWSLARTAD